MSNATLVVSQAGPGVDPSIVADGFMMAALLTMGTLFAVVPILISMLISPKETHTKLGAIYECGMKTYGRARDARFGIFYYLYAILFIVFEVDVLYLLPVVRIYRQGVGITGFFEMLFFVAVLFLAVIYALKKGVLKWDQEALSLR